MYVIYTTEDCQRCEEVKRILPDHVLKNADDIKTSGDIDALTQLQIQNQTLPLVWDDTAKRWLDWKEIKEIKTHMAFEGGE